MTDLAGLVTRAQASDYQGAWRLLEALLSSTDLGYNTDWFCKGLRETDISPYTGAHMKRRDLAHYDKVIYEQ